MVLINGESRHVLEIADRGFQYGDGLFETLAVIKCKPLFWQRHLHRLLRGCERLKIPSPDPLVLASEVARLCESASERNVLKLIITRGSGGRGYRMPDDPIVTRALALHPYPLYPDSHYSDGINLRLCATRLGHNRQLAGLKHLNRLEQIMARAEWDDNNVHEGLVCDQNGYIVEGTMSNVFLFIDDQLVTPALDECGVAGIVRDWVIDKARASGLVVNEARVSVDMIFRASEVFVTNSVIGIWPVKQLETLSFKIGSVTRWLQSAYDDACAEEVSL